MNKHRFQSDLKADAQKNGNALFACACRGNGHFDLDMEGQYSPEFVLKLTQFILHVTKRKNVNLIPTIEE